MTKKYNKAIDNNSKSGRGRVDFQWFNVMDDFLGAKGSAVDEGLAVSSTLPTLQQAASIQQPREMETSSILSNPNRPSTSQQALIENPSEKENSSILSNINRPSTSRQGFIENSSEMEPSGIQEPPPANVSANKCNHLGKRNRYKHGSGTSAAAKKIALQEEWIAFLKTSEERAKVKTERDLQSAETKKEGMKLKKKQLSLKEKEIQERKQIATNKAMEKKKNHVESMEIERMKFEVLKTFCEKTKKRDKCNSDESE